MSPETRRGDGLFHITDSRQGKGNGVYAGLCFEPLFPIQILGGTGKRAGVVPGGFAVFAHYAGQVLDGGLGPGRRSVGEIADEQEFVGLGIDMPVHHVGMGSTRMGGAAGRSHIHHLRLPEMPGRKDIFLVRGVFGDHGHRHIAGFHAGFQQEVHGAGGRRVLVHALVIVPGNTGAGSRLQALQHQIHGQVRLLVHH